ncbi:MAG: ATP-binding protein [Ruminococcaceae bacterium]|nr:ATP-binding protein [Oscillospiraceae bacterium]
MAYDPQVVKAARERLEARRNDAANQALAWRNRLCAQYPRLAEIERELAATLPAITEVVLHGGTPEELQTVQDNNLALQREMADILHAAGYPADNFDPLYTCPHCQDTGYTDGHLCDCYRQLLREEACKHLSSLSAMKLTDFDSLDVDYYDATPDPQTGLSPRQRMQDTIAYCRTYAARFSPTADSLLLQGSTGTGKTHLCLAVARTVAEQGFGVVYGSVQPLLRRMESEHFGRADGDSEAQLIGCDLLVLDDLGMEFDSPFYRACVYNILNARLLEGRPTIISTNLSFTALRERYGDQIASRIMGGFVPLLCVGKDIRQLMRMRQMQ